MDTTMSEVVQFIQENDVKFIRLAFCDIFGNQKNIAIMPTELERAFEQGIHFNAAALRGFLNVEASDLLLFPDPATLSVLPWRPAQGRVVRFYCDIRYPDGTPFEGDGRHLLREANRRARRAGYSLTMGTASEFYLFELDENGHPTTIPHDHGEYFDVAPLDKAENVRRQICLTLEEMNIQPESSHHEQGPGQNEVDFRYAEALEAADNFVTFKWVVKSMASSSGLFASFLPKPLPHAPGSGLHLSVSINKNGKNLFQPSFEESAEGQSFVAGILQRAAEMTIFCNPLTNSFQRLGEFEAPKYITWSHQNSRPLITVPLSEDSTAHRFKLRAFDGCINPYIVESGILICTPPKITAPYFFRSLAAHPEPSPLNAPMVATHIIFLPFHKEACIWIKSLTMYGAFENCVGYPRITVSFLFILSMINSSSNGTTSADASINFTSFVTQYFVLPVPLR